MKNCNLLTANQVNTSQLIKSQLTNTEKPRFLTFFGQTSLGYHTVNSFTLRLAKPLKDKIFSSETAVNRFNSQGKVYSYVHF